MHREEGGIDRDQGQIGLTRNMFGFTVATGGIL